jgi:hypothetical protein
MALIPASNTSRALAYDFSVALSWGDCAKEVNDTNKNNAIHNLFGTRVSSENSGLWIVKRSKLPTTHCTLPTFIYAIKVAIVAGH